MRYDKSNRRSLRSLLSKYTSELTGNMSLIELYSDQELSVSGCELILEYDSRTIHLKTISGELFIEGDNLFLNVFQSETINISGRIKKVAFKDYD